jgi:hypothetical protein
VKRIAVLIRDKDKLYEGLRTSLGLSLVDHQVSMYVLGHEIPTDEAYRENMGFLLEMGGLLYTNVQASAQQHGFRYLSSAQLPQKLLEYEIIIPF